MKDIRSKIDKLIKDDLKSIQAIVNKYSSVLELTKPQQQIPYHGYIIDTSIQYINEKHKEIHIDQKTWAVLLIKILFDTDKIKTDEDIHKTIDDFFEFWKTEYVKYCEDTISATDFDRDREFIYRFIHKK